MAVSSEHLSEKELLDQLEQARKEVVVGALYVHYRDRRNPYRVIDLAILEASQEPSVLYKKESASSDLSSITWVRPLSSWLEKVDFEGSMVSRFQKIS
jgi:hypothetical protein